MGILGRISTKPLDINSPGAARGDSGESAQVLTTLIGYVWRQVKQTGIKNVPDSPNYYARLA
jgi:hypothetical protein